MNRLEQINEILGFMRSGTPDVEGCALVSEDGLMIASAFPAQYDEGRIAGMTSTLLSLGSRTSEELERGELEQVFVKGKQGYVVAMNASEGTVFMVLTNQAAKLGLIFLDMKRTVTKIVQVL
jgi:predicted regulator of Ras-like GTPase activity (Roadblock/LC7/MglB family)